MVSCSFLGGFQGGGRACFTCERTGIAVCSAFILLVYFVDVHRGCCTRSSPQDVLAHFRWNIRSCRIGADALWLLRGGFWRHSPIPDGRDEVSIPRAIPPPPCPLRRGQRRRLSRGWAKEHSVTYSHFTAIIKRDDFVLLQFITLFHLVLAESNRTPN